MRRRERENKTARGLCICLDVSQSDVCFHFQQEEQHLQNYNKLLLQLEELTAKYEQKTFYLFCIYHQQDSFRGLVLICSVMLETAIYRYEALKLHAQQKLDEAQRLLEKQKEQYTTELVSLRYLCCCCCCV
jgi:hypothetical protein